MRRRVSFSRNVTLSLSRTCASHCKYCAFATHQPHLQSPDEVRALLDGAARRRVKELLVLTGEAPDHHPGVVRKLEAFGFASWLDYVIWACREGLDRGLLPHTNLGTLDSADLARLREVTASQGLMLESLRDDLVAHQGSPSKDPALRLRTIRAAGELKIPFTSGILVGIGETPEDRIEALEALAAVHAEHGHLQEVILQNFVPHRRYYGEEPAAIATDAAEQYWRTGLSDAPHRDLPEWAGWAGAISLEDMEALIGHARRLMPGVGIQVPPNLADWWPRLVAAGATDLGGLSANGDHISPEHPFPSPHAGAQAPGPRRRRAERAPLRLPASTSMPSGSTSRCSTSSRRGTGASSRAAARAAARRRSRSRRDGVAASIRRARDGHELTPPELTALFAETRPEAIEDMRQAADELRAELMGDTVTYVVNRNVNVSNVCIVGCAFCGFGQGRRSPDAYEHDRDEFVSRLDAAVAYGATELCMQSGIHPDWSLEDYLGWLRLARDAAPSLHLHAYSPMEIAHMCDISGLSPDAVFELLRDAGLGSTPGTAAEVLHDGVRERISPNKLPVARWVEIIEASHRAGLRSTATVMFGHVEEPWELAEHMRVVRGLAERTGGITEFVPLSFIPFHTLLGRTHGVQEISREENLKHTSVFRLALGRSDPQRAGQLGQDGPRRRHRGAALGRQRPRRHADGGVDQPPRRLLPRRQARPARPDRRRPPRRAPGGRAHDALRTARPPPGRRRGIVGPSADPVAFRRRLAARGGVLGQSCGRATSPSLRPCHERRIRGRTTHTTHERTHS